METVEDIVSVTTIVAVDCALPVAERTGNCVANRMSGDGSSMVIKLGLEQSTLVSPLL